MKESMPIAYTVCMLFSVAGLCITGTLTLIPAAYDVVNPWISLVAACGFLGSLVTEIVAATSWVKLARKRSEMEAK